jgi:hypothetical protein
MADDDRLTAELAAIKERGQAATPSPWGAGEDENSWRLSGDLDTGFRPPCLIEAAKYSAYGPSYWPNEADAAFIVAARTDVPRLAAALEKALELHGSVPWYASAMDCEHPEPPEDSEAHDDWYDDHTSGTGGIVVCLLTQVDSLCPECTRLKYDTLEPEGDDFVSAPCGTRSAILKAITGAEGESPCVLDAAPAGSPGAPTLTATGRARSPSCPASRRYPFPRASRSASAQPSWST